MNTYSAVVGFSTNPEIIVRYDTQNPSPKLPASEFSYQISGTSSDVAIGLKQLGVKPLLLGTVGLDEEDVNSIILRHLLAKNGLNFHLMPVREATNVALQPLDDGQPIRVVGKKTPAVPALLPEAALNIKRIVEAEARSAWRVATGILDSDMPLVEALFFQGDGRRIANPRDSLMSGPRASELLRSADILICNMDEFIGLTGSVCQSAFESVHDLGPSLIVVTLSSKGAMVSLHGGEILSVPAVHAGQCLSEVGAGDWWLAGFLTGLSHRSIFQVGDLDADSLIYASRFASFVAGLKVTKFGASSGPMLSEVQTLMESALSEPTAVGKKGQAR